MGGQHSTNSVDGHESNRSTYSVEGYESNRCETPCSHITLRHDSKSNTSVGAHTHCHTTTSNCTMFDTCLKESHLSVDATKQTFTPDETFWKCFYDVNGVHDVAPITHKKPGHPEAPSSGSYYTAPSTADSFPKQSYFTTPTSHPPTQTAHSEGDFSIRHIRPAPQTQM